ncbi:MAG: transposase [Planctomycetes bacterium]|nr:transposase [Planctomycetota bacterium]
MAKIDERRQVRAKSALPQNPTSQALAYLNNQWDALNRYIDDPILSIDNNLAERTIRRVTLGRKNWLFAGGDAGGDRAGIHYSLIARRKLCKIGPFHDIKDVMDRISSHPASRSTELLPSNWKPVPTAAWPPESIPKNIRMYFAGQLP